MDPQRHEQIVAAGRDISPELIQTMWALFAPLHEGREALSRVESDLVYGPDPRHRLDVHQPVESGDGARPVFVFVHGGGFVGGDKQAPGMPYYRHIGTWAAEHGMLAVTPTYRLAPEHGWPAGARDVDAAIGWVRANIARHGGNPRQIIVAGHSAGAVHVASYLARVADGEADAAGVVGAALLSGVYDLATAERNPVLRAYFGEDESAYAERSPFDGLLRSRIPTLYASAELNPSDFQRQAAGILAAKFAQDGELPPFVWVQGHNHISEIVSLGVDDALGGPLARFVDAAVASAPR